jgi:hypothetical protein
LDWLRVKRDEVPTHVRVSQVRLRVSLPGMDNIRELDWVPDEEERSIIKYHITDSFFGV